MNIMLHQLFTNSKLPYVQEMQYVLYDVCSVKLRPDTTAQIQGCGSKMLLKKRAHFSFYQVQRNMIISRNFTEKIMVLFEMFTQFSWKVGQLPQINRLHMPSPSLINEQFECSWFRFSLSMNYSSFLLLRSSSAALQRFIIVSACFLCI